MRYLLFLVCLLANPACCCGQQSDAAAADVPAVFNTIEELSAAKTDATVAFVREPLRGGVFTFTADKKKADNGVIFRSAKKGFWVRSYNEHEGVDAKWFGAKMDSMTNDANALKSALIYDKVCINGLLKIEGKVKLPEGKTIVFTARGGMLLADSCMVSFDAYIKAEDYADIFTGNGNIVFGGKAAGYVSPCWFGAIADYRKPGLPSTDNTTPIQKAIIAAEKVSDVYLPPTPANTAYRIASGLIISKKLHFFSFKFHGGGTTITGNSADKATTIFADFSSGAAINIQGSRRSYISDFRLQGKNNALERIFKHKWSSNFMGTPSYDTVSYFIDSGIKRSYAGIATDADKSNKVLSADIQFDRLQIEGFYVGLSINDAGNLQGDRMRVNNTQINNCTYGISIGNPQARACNFENIDMNKVYIAYTNSTLGNHTGSEFQISGGQYCNIYKLFHIQPYNLGQCVVTGLYAEGLGSIGEIGYGGVHDNSFIFTGCCFQTYEVAGGSKVFGVYAGYYTLSAYANVSFIGCNFRAKKQYMAFRTGEEGASVKPGINFSGCTFYATSFVHGWGNVNFENTHYTAEDEPFDMNRTIRARLDGKRRYNTGYYATSVAPLFDGISSDSLNPAAARQISRAIPVFYSVQDGKDGISDTTVRYDTLTFSYNDELDKSLFRYVIPGDILGTTIKGLPTQWDNPTLRVLAIDHAAKKITAFKYTEAFTFDKIALYTNCFFTTQPLSGTINTGSAVITNTDNEQLLRAGDFIMFKGAEHAYRIAGTDTNAHTVTLMDTIKETGYKNITFYNLQLYGIQ